MAYNSHMHDATSERQVTPPYPLLSGERLLSITQHPPRIFEASPSSLQQMMRLTRVSSPNAIGEHGPSVASLAFEVSARTSVEPGESPLNAPVITDETLVSVPEHLRLYEVVFGRDSLRVAIDLISSYPELARTTVLRLAELQGVEYDTSREEEPGRIVHEARDKDDPIAVDLSERLGWGWPYYGSVDATPEFVRTLAAYVRRTEENAAFLSQDYVDKSGTSRNVAYALDMAINWILRRLNSNEEGLLEYKAVLPLGIENQVWKDSWDAYHHADGTIANHEQGIASIEVQVTTYDALLDAAEIYENVLDNADKATALRERAARLKHTIVQEFWTDDKGGYFVLGTDRGEDGRLRQMKIRTSNMGHVLNSRLLEDGSEASERMFEAVLRHVLSPEMLNVSGIRTLARDELRFRAGAYHNGSVWLWDTHHIAKGIRRRGDRRVALPFINVNGQLVETLTCKDIARDLDLRALNVVDVTKIFPEYARGDDGEVPSINTETVVLWDEAMQRENKVEQPPQEVQAWTVAAILATKKRIAREATPLSS